MSENTRLDRAVEWHPVGALGSGTIKADPRDDNNGGASHLYVVSYRINDEITSSTVISFQRGPVGEVGINGITNEDLLAIAIDRLEGFQTGAFACHENESALTFIRRGLDCLKERTTGRVKRGVEGTNIP